MSQQEKISVYNLADLKNTTDDAIPNYLNSLGFTQSHTLTDVRLGLGYLALLTAAACFAWDYHLGFEATKLPTALAVAFYALLNAALTAWILLVERGAVYAGASPDGRARVRLTSATAKVPGKAPEYRLTVEVSDAATGKVTETVELRRGFDGWFDAAGRFVAAPFQVVLAGKVGVIGQADPKRREAAAAEGRERVVDEAVAAGYTPEMLAALQGAVPGAEVSGADVGAGKKGGKRRKA